MHWLEAVARLRRERRPGVLVTVADVRGHAPRDAGAKMVVAVDEVWGTIGGGNLEETTIARCRALLASGADGPEPMVVSLSDKARTDHGRQCCGGEVMLLLEPLAVVPSVAIFGMGHVGLELARILSRHDLELHLVDSRAAYVDPTVLAVLEGGQAVVHAHHAPVPEAVLGYVPCGTHVRASEATQDPVPPGTHVLVMTHDHAEDFSLCDTALRCSHLGTVGLIGSAAKWSRFEKGLLVEGHRAEAIAGIRCPIGTGPPGKEPAVIALGVAAELLGSWRAADRARG